MGQSALEGRRELKYLVPLECVSRIKRQLGAYCEADAHNQGGRSYRVESIYYDSSAYRMYHENLAGIAKRRKLRVRFYPTLEHPSPAQCFVEIKRRDCSCISKSRLKAPLSRAMEIVEKGRKDDEFFEELADPDRKVLEEVWFLARGLKLRPLNRVGYDRFAFRSRFDPTVRVTLDMNVSCAAPDVVPRTKGKWMTVLNRRQAILEIKYTWSIPSWIRSIVDANDCTVQRMSKYVASVQAVFHKRRHRFRSLKNNVLEINIR